MPDAALAKNLALPIRRVEKDAPWRWLAAGWRDLLAMPRVSLAYGAVFVGVGLVVTLVFVAAGLSAALPATAAGFMLVGPILAVGLYEASRRRAAGLLLAWRDIVFVKTASPLQLAYLGFFLMFALLIWMRVATLLYALFTEGHYEPLGEFIAFVLTTPQGLGMLVFGTAIGAVLAFAVFALAALSVPILMHRKVDVMTAIATSLKAVIESLPAMLLWAWLIALLIAAGLATFFVGLIVVFPLVGHATWHAYVDFFGGKGQSVS